jgi:phytoene synthase
MSLPGGKEGPVPECPPAGGDCVEHAARLDYLLAEARRVDPDRYLCALFAPASRREPLLALAVLGQELARVPHTVTQPMAGLIRYQWWRDAIDEAAAGRPRAQPVVEGLAVGLRPGWLRVDVLQALVDAHEAQLEAGGPAGPEVRQEATSGALQELVIGSLGPATADQQAAARRIGTAMGLVEVVAQGEDRSLLDRAGELLSEARRLAPRPPRQLLSAFLPARLAAARARRLQDGRAGARPPLAVLDLLLADLLGRY